MAKAYTLKEHKITGEYHIFVGDITQNTPRECTSINKSDCGRMTKEQSLKNIFRCKDEVEARKLCAVEGRKVCANCVEELYKTIK